MIDHLDKLEANKRIKDDRLLSKGPQPRISKPMSLKLLDYFLTLSSEDNASYRTFVKRACITAAALQLVTQLSKVKLKELED